MNDNRNYGLDIARIIATKIRNYKRDFSVFDRKILVYYMLYSTYRRLFQVLCKHKKLI